MTTSDNLELCAHLTSQIFKWRKSIMGSEHKTPGTTLVTLLQAEHSDRRLRETKDESWSSTPEEYTDNGSGHAEKNAATVGEIASDGSSSTDSHAHIQEQMGQNPLPEMKVLQPTVELEVLDPSSPDFDVHEWAKMVLSETQKSNIRIRRATIAFMHLDVLASGGAAKTQSTVASLFLAPFQLYKHISLGKKPQRRILDSFDGIVNSGEMLLVLGRPGSGCTTLLKTIAGELNGLHVAEHSHILYNGMSLTYPTYFVNLELTHKKDYRRST